MFASWFTNGCGKLSNQQNGYRLTGTQQHSSEGWSHLDKRPNALGKQTENRTDLANHALPAGCETTLRRWEQTGRTGEIRG